MSLIAHQLTRDNTFGFLNSNVLTDQVYHPILVSNSDGNTMLRAIRNELKRSQNFVFSVAFITPGAIALLKQAFLDYRGRGTIITSIYLRFNAPTAFRELLNLANICTDIRVFVYPDSDAGFHAKGYIFEQGTNTTAIVGSSNLTELALLKNKEWNLRFSALPNGDIVQQIIRAAEENIKASSPLTSQWIDRYEKTWSSPFRKSLAAFNPIENSTEAAVADVIHPNSMQIEALAEITELRNAGETRGVVISATGTGKTILSALDVRAYAPNRMLFIVHREQILDRAIQEFKRVLGEPDNCFGKFVGGKREIDHRYVFASIQSISQPEILETIKPDAFDYVLIDEVHRAGAKSYRRVIDYLKPAFMLGITATPERTDEFNVFELFGFNVPYEIRLQKALEANMLVPFHYYGVTDYELENGEVINQFSGLTRLVASERINHLIKAVEKYGHAGLPVRGLIFCSQNDEATEISNLLNQRLVHNKCLRTVALSGRNSINEREKAVRQLEEGLLDYIVTVDIFNEGIDIPSVNQIIMLRQTLSSIIFTQQLGRGLRKAANKDYLVVIDFIGNYDNNYLIPIALFGDSSLNKDSIRKKIIDAQEAGAIAGLSSVNFDAISKERIYRSLDTTRLNSIANLRKCFLDLQNRLGRIPLLQDFARFDLADPVVIASTASNYFRFLNKVGASDKSLGVYEDAVLTFLCEQLLNGKRSHELLLLKELLMNSGVCLVKDFYTLLEKNNLTTDAVTLSSVAGVLSLRFFTQAETKKYGAAAVADVYDDAYKLNEYFLLLCKKDLVLKEHVMDIIDTGLYLAKHRYNNSCNLLVGQRYSRKDVCRLLNWKSNQQSTIYGYKVDFPSNSCPIFVTYHKRSDVSESTRYEDEFLNPSTLKWFTRSKRTLQSQEVKAIVENQIPLYIFAKKDDAEGTDFYFLGKATAHDARQTTMAGKSGSTLDVVTMALHLASPIETSLYEYFYA